MDEWEKLFEKETGEPAYYGGIGETVNSAFVEWMKKKASANITLQQMWEYGDYCYHQGWDHLGYYLPEEWIKARLK
jgi:hypothetical protein